MVLGISDIINKMSMSAAESYVIHVARACFCAHYLIVIRMFLKLIKFLLLL